MKAGIWFGLGLVVAGGSAMLAAQDARITMAKLPPAVQQTVKAQLAQGATLRGLSTDNEDGKPEYEAELTVSGHHRDLAMDSDGNILETEDAVALSSLPAAAQAALRKAGRVLSVEAVSHHGAFVAYEAVVRKADGKRTEVRVDRAGKSVPDNG